MKLLAEIDPLSAIALRPISLACRKLSRIWTYKYFLDVTLFFILLPVSNRYDLKVFKHINERMLPKILNTEWRL